MIQQGRSLTEVLSETTLPARDSSFIKALCYGCLRWYGRYDFIAQQLLQKPFKAKDFYLHALIIVGLYQLTDTRVPAHAAIAETVAAARELNASWATGLINAVLRRYQREMIPLQTIIAEKAEAYYAHPIWLLKKLATIWPEQWQTILNANNVAAPLTLRVNLTRQNRLAYLASLQKQGLTAAEHRYATAAIVVTTPVDVTDLPGFAEGDVSVQDAAAQLAADLLQLEAGQHVLDACAAPGGKTAHLLEMQPQLAQVIALEKNPIRCQKIAQTLQRLQLHATIHCVDATDTGTWFDGRLFDRILLDVPCSATGVIRRHPDIKWQRRESDINELVQQQAKLLKKLWPLLKVGGLLLYATCSILPEENTQQIENFLQQHADASEVIISAVWGIKQVAGRQILPGEYDMDGFYYACLRKTG